MERPNPYIDKLKDAIGYEDNIVTFLHNTLTEANAVKIINDGFRFLSHLDYTTDVVTNKDDITITYFNLTRNAYGPFTIIIQIDKEIINYYSELLQNKHNHFSELLTHLPPDESNDGDWIYTLAPNFVKGYVDSKRVIFHQNPVFNPSLRHPHFEENLSKLRKF